VWAAVKALETRVAALEPTPPTPPADPDTVHIGPLLKTANTLLGWTSVQEQDHTATTAAILAKCSHINNTHIIGFGADRPIQTVEGGPYDFTYLDAMFKYFPATAQRCITLCGSPPYMRVPKAGTALMPMGTPPSGLYDYHPPHWSHHDNWAKLAAAIVDRYQIDVVHEWNEWKGEYIGTPATGSVIVPPGSDLPLFAGPWSNRWAMEMHTDRYNHVYTAVKAVRPDCKVLGPYMVTRTYTDANNPDAADGTFPKELHGPWGYGDWKAMQAVMYWLEHAVGIDAICLDTKTSSNDASILPEYEWDGLAKITDWQNWLSDLAAYDPTRYSRALTPLWFAEAYSRVIGGLTPTNHQRAVAIDAWGYINHVLPNDVAGWMRWQPEGNRSATDSATAHSISLWHAKGSAKSLQETEAVLVYAGLVEQFKPGTPLYSVTVDHPDVSGIASDKVMCLVSRLSGPVDLVVFNGFPITLAPYEVKFVPVTS